VIIVSSELNMQGSKPTWLPPKPGEAKLNVDGAFTQDGAGTGMVLRDHQDRSFSRRTDPLLIVEML
jgi:hypothetical protein